MKIELFPASDWDRFWMMLRVLFYAILSSVAIMIVWQIYSHSLPLPRGNSGFLRKEDITFFPIWVLSLLLVGRISQRMHEARIPPEADTRLSSLLRWMPVSILFFICLNSVWMSIKLYDLFTIALISAMSGLGFCIAWIGIFIAVKWKILIDSR